MSAAAALLATSLVVWTSSDRAAAAGPAPTVTAGSAQTLILGEDATIAVGIRNPAGTEAIYNLSVTALLPDTVEVVSTGALGAGVLHQAGDTLTGGLANGDTCAALGLDGPDAGPCKVPAGKQYLVFQNISDLPATGTVDTQLVLRPKVDQTDSGDIANGFVVGDLVDVQLNAYTSSVERLIPLFPGSTSRGGTAAANATSSRGSDRAEIEVNALRITKSEPSPEDELLRGVHTQTTIYTLTIHHTGEGDLTDAVVVDYLPAGLEYLGSCDLDDHTTTANGNGDAEEYQDSGPLRTGDAGAGCLDEASIQTVRATAAEAERYGLVAGEVYTKVTWNVGEWLADRNAAGSNPRPQAEDLSQPGRPGSTVIRYRAGVPLFENELFDSAAEAALGLRGQGANLDNNTGPSTRHGSDAADGDDKQATSWTNAATAQGSWTGVTGTLTPATAEDVGHETVDAVDVRVLKSVRVGGGEWADSASFEQGRIANYRLQLATSEYVGARIGDRPSRLVDRLANGLCPVYPAGAALTPGNPNADNATVPAFILGDPGDLTNPTYVTQAEYEAALAKAGLSECAWGNTDDEAQFSGATLTAIAFNPATGEFHQELQLAPVDALGSPNATAEIIYSARQNANYLDAAHVGGATSSGDTVENSVEFEATTTARDEVNGLENAGDHSAGDEYQAWDDSAASVHGDFSDIGKYVLRRPFHAGVDASTIWELDYGTGAVTDPESDDFPWTKHETQPFAPGDQIWFKLHWRSARGVDVRNPVLTDFLPEGVSFDRTGLDSGNEWESSQNLRVLLTAGGAPLALDAGDPLRLGECSYPSNADALAGLVGKVGLADGDTRLTWQLGSADCYPDETPGHSADRFWPGGVDLDVYLRVTVTDAQAFQAVDLSQNLAKYQQNNSDGVLFFLRDQAEIQADQSVRLIKGIASNDHVDPATGQPGYPNDNGFESNVDNQQVVQQDRVAFRLDIRAPGSDTSGYRVVDVLPAGIAKADVDNTSFTAALVTDGTESPLTDPGQFSATVLDPGDAGYGELDLKPGFAGRSVIVWNVAATVPASTPAGVPNADAPAVVRGLTLGYTVVLPDQATGRPAELGRSYVNDASITQFDYQNVTGGSSTMIVQGDQTVVNPRDPQPGEFVFDDVDNDASDPSGVTVPTTTGRKVLVSTEVGPNTPVGADGAVGRNDLGSNNNGEQIVQGEYATFRYSVTIPGHTTVRNAVLADDGVFRYNGNSVAYQFVPGQLSDFRVLDATGNPVGGFDWTGFDRNTGNGSLTFPAAYTNTTADPQVFTVDITVWVKDRDRQNPDQVPDLADGTILTNTARFSWTNPNDPVGAKLESSDTAQATYREPGPVLLKEASKSTGVKAGETITYTLRANNGIGLPTSFDSVVYDCVPDGLTNVTIGTASQGTATVLTDKCRIVDGRIERGTDAAYTGTLIQWNVGAINATSPKTLTYTVKVSEEAGAAAKYRNYAEITGHTLPTGGVLGDTTGRRGAREALTGREITLQDAVLTKTSNPTSAPVGAEVEYRLVATLPSGLNFYNVSLTDTLPTGVTYTAGSAVVTKAPAAAPGWPDIPATPQVSGQTLTWLAQSAGTDIPSYEADRTITITFKARITTAVNQATSVTNRASFGWDSANTGGTRTTKNTSAVTTLLNPVLSLTKKVDGVDSKSFNPDGTFTYTVTVTNTGNTPAYNVDLTDAVPANVIVTGTIPDGGVLTGNDPNTGGGTITWNDLGPISNVAPGNTKTLTYTARFADSQYLTTADRVNTARVTRYESFGEGGRVYLPGQGGVPQAQDTALVRTVFPHVVPTKSVTSPVPGQSYGIAVAGQPFGWTLTVRNTGTGTAQDVGVTDTLPANWDYRPGSAKIGGVTLADPAVVGQTLTWTPEQLRLAGVTPLAAGTQFAITFDAIPSEAALSTPGTGVGNAEHVHRNTLNVTATDTQGNTGNAQTPTYTGTDSTADAYLAEADPKLVKEAIGGVASGATDARLKDLPPGTWVPGQNVVTGQYTQPQWRITVTNQGPDPAEGPFEFTDDLTLPTGVTTGTWSARYYSGPSDTTGTPLVLVIPDPAHPGVFRVGDDTTALKADGSDRIVLLANVTIAPGATASGEELKNVATVTGRTYENPENEADNTDQATKPLAPIADLRIQKVVNTEQVIVGSTITWGITVTNLGPSVSVASEDRPITITDTVPAGVSGVTASSNGDWTATLDDGSAIPEAGVGPGTTIRWTYTGVGMPVAGTAQVTLTGTISTAHTGPLTNAATVTPGETTDPVEPNNRDEVSVDPDDSTRLAIAKTRVVFSGGTWRLPTVDEPFVAGEPISYRIDVTNNGPADARNVRVVDESPASLTYDAHVTVDADGEPQAASWTRTAGGTNGAGTSNPGWDTFALSGTQAVGATDSFVVTYTSAPDTAGDVVNWSEASATNATNKPRDPDNSGSTRDADLSIAKSHTSPTGDAPAVAGGTVDYRLVVTNNGPSDSSAPIDVVDTLPAGLSYRDGTARVSVNGGPAGTVAPAVSGQELSWSNLTSGSDLRRNGTIVITFTADVAADLREQDDLTNLATVSGPEDTDPTNNQDTDPVDVVTRAEMVVGKTVEAGPWVAGTDVQYTLTIRNDGPSEAPASITDTLPTGLTMVSMSGTGWDCATVAEGASSGSCTFTGNSGLHPVGSAAATTITVTAHIAPNATDLAQPLKNTADLSWTDSRGSHTDDADVDITVTRAADLGIVKTALDAADGDETTTATAGESVWYRLVVSNHGPSDAIAPIMVTDTLPAGISFGSLTGASAANWTAAVDETDPQQITFTRTPAAGIALDGAAPEIVFEARIDSAVADGTDLVNTAAIDEATLDPNGDPNSDNDSDDAEVTVEREVELVIEKAHVSSTPDEFPVGAEVSFTLDVANNGPSVASGIQVTDTLPVGLTYLRLSGTGWTLVDASVNPDGTTTVVAGYDDDLAAGGEAGIAPTLTIVAEVTVDIGDELTATNRACVASSEENTNPDPCDTDEIVTVPLADLTIAKSVDTPAAEIGAGREISWQLDVRNLGPSDSLSSATGRITVTDELPAGITGVVDPSTELWTATVTRAGSPSTFPAQAGDLITWTFQGERIAANPDPEAPPAHSLTLTGRIDASWTDGEIDNLAAVGPGETRDPDDSNNADDVTVAPGDGTSLRIAKVRVVQVDGEWVIAVEQDPIPPFEPGSDLSYLITVINDGPADARQVTVVDETPDGLTYRDHESLSGSWQRQAGGVSSTGENENWDTFLLESTQPVGPDAARSFVVTYSTDPALPDDAALVNWAEVTAENWPDGYDRDDDDITSSRSADLSIVKTHTSPAPGEAVLAGGTVDYQLTVTNLGPSISDAPIVVTDSLPSDFSYVTGSATVSIDGGPAVAVEPQVDGRRLTWADLTDGETLPVGSTVVITFTASVAKSHGPAQDVLNVAVVEGPNDHNPLNDRDQDPIDVKVKPSPLLPNTGATIAAGLLAAMLAFLLLGTTAVMIARGGREEEAG